LRAAKGTKVFMAGDSNSTDPSLPKRIVEVITGSAAFRAAEKEAADKVAAERKKLAAELARLDHAETIDFPRRQERIAAAIAAAIAAQQRAIEAGFALNKERGDATSAAFAFQRQRDALAAKLAETSHPAITPFIAELHALQDGMSKLRAPTPVIVRNEITRTVETVGLSIHDAVLARLAAIRAAIEAAELLRLAADQTKVPVELDKLRAALPGVPGAEEPQ
jgi:hypothetical protein